MFSLLKLLIIYFISTLCFAQESAYSQKKWARLLHFEDGEFKAHHRNVFYLSAKSLEDEWISSVNAIKNKTLVGREKKVFACSFPARYEFIRQYLPSLSKESCPDFQEWKTEIGAKEIVLVYASSYLSNPASMFGHSLLRLSRGGRSRASVLSDYTVGFLAQTNPDDNPLSYTVKGVTGGYIGYYEIKPFYQNVGLYQNSEARDLWQYPLKLSQEQVDFFVSHLYELSLNTGFDYYFFDENCSSVILRTLQVVDEDFNFLDQSYVFAHPIETLKWARDALDHERVTYYPSINKIVRNQLDQMNSTERDLFQRANRDIEVIHEIKSPIVLDALIDYWKFKNYKEETKISQINKKRMNLILKKRASIDTITDNLVMNRTETDDPLKFHDPNKWELGYLYTKNSEVMTARFALGYQDLDDIHIGHDNFSFINYFDFNFQFRENVLSLKDLTLVKIHSLSPYYNEIKSFSWEIDLSVKRSSYLFSDKHLSFLGGVGYTLFLEKLSLSGFLGFENFLSKSLLELKPYLSFYARAPLKRNLILIQSKLHYDSSKISRNLSMTYAHYIKKNVSARFMIEDFKSNFSQTRARFSLRFRF